MTLTNIFTTKLSRRLAAVGLITALAAATTSGLVRAAESAPVVKITAGKFQFTPDHITLVKGQPVTLELTSTDVTHGFMIRALKIDTDVKPGQVTDVTVTPASAGTFKAICDHYCGLGHGGMKMTVVIEEATAKAGSSKIMTASNTVSK